MAGQEILRQKIAEYTRHVNGAEQHHAIPYYQVMTRIAAELRRYGGAKYEFTEADTEGIESIVAVVLGEPQGPDTSAIWDEACAELRSDEGDIVEIVKLVIEAQQIQEEHLTTSYEKAISKLSPEGQRILKEVAIDIAKKQSTSDLDWIAFARGAPIQARRYMEQLCAKRNEDSELSILVRH